MERPGDRWFSVGLSVLLHLMLLAALVYGWMLFRRPPPPAPTLAIDATVVDARAVPGETRPLPTPAPPPPEPKSEPEPEPQGPPPPNADELTRREQERAAAAAAEQHAAEERAAQAQAAQRLAAEEARRRLEEQRKADAQHKAEERRKAEEQRRATERAAQEQKAEAARQAGEREDLRRSLAAEEQARAARGPALASWQAQIQARISRAWLRPPTARPGIECDLDVTQVPGGTVTKVSIGQCNGDQAVRESIEAAVYRASPLPPPPDPSLFDTDLHIHFKPD
ncbi:MAG: cell envelope integrity protein TolA [Gammaproteobacteria bacterium]|nr:cell envelope integrity protein TolA [Gammaproteobacteria bacterium]